MSILLDEDSQRTILSLGSPLSPQQREAFYQRVAQELEVQSLLGPGLVARIAAKVRREFLDSPTLDD
jgi:hypothetical protein